MKEHMLKKKKKIIRSITHSHLPLMMLPSSRLPTNTEVMNPGERCTYADPARRDALKVGFRCLQVSAAKGKMVLQ